MPNPVVHFEIQSTETGARPGFFREVFGMASMWGPRWSNGLVKPVPIRDKRRYRALAHGENTVISTSEVDDLQGYLDRAVAAGGRVVMPVTVVPGP